MLLHISFTVNAVAAGGPGVHLGSEPGGAAARASRIALRNPWAKNAANASTHGCVHEPVAWILLQRGYAPKNIVPNS